MAKTIKTQHQRRYKVLLEELKRTRLEAGIKQREVSARLGKHPPFISKIESGERRIDVLELADLCECYGISLFKFLKRAGFAS